MTSARKTWTSLWRGTLTPKLKPHWRWYGAGRTGEGRIVMCDENLQGAAVRGLEGARFERCDFSGAMFSLMDDTELVECIFDEAQFNGSAWDGAHIERCRFHGAWIGLGYFDRTTIEGGDWLGSYLERTSWTEATIRDVSFRCARLVDARFDAATFVGCEFTHANLSRKELEGDLARCPGARFVRCDFRGAHFDGLRFNNTTFEQCLFHDTTGRPDLEGKCTLIDPDFSRDGDGSDVRDPDQVLRVWRDADVAKLNHWSIHGDKVRYQPERHYPERSGSR